MSAPNEGETNPASEAVAESSGTHSLATTMKTSVVWLVVILAILVLFTWGAVEFELLPKGSPK